MERNARIFVAGHRGLLGSALTDRLAAQGAEGAVGIITRTREALDLTDQQAVERFFREERPEYVVLAAARVGGIIANQAFPAEFITENLLIQTNVIRSAHAAGVRRLLFFGSNCAYPMGAPQPLREERLGAGPLEPSSVPYARAKLAGTAMCEAFNRQYGTCFLSLIPATLYGPHDNFDPETSHVVSGLMRRLHEAKGSGRPTFSVWGSGKALREFVYVDDLVEACLLLLWMDEGLLRRVSAASGYVINVGSGEEVSTKALAEALQGVVGFAGQIICDSSKPEGASRKVLDSTVIRRLGWRPDVPLREGLRRTYEWFVTNLAGDPAHAR